MSGSKPISVNIVLVSQERFEVEVPADATIGVLCDSIADRGYKRDTLKLVFKGKQKTDMAERIDAMKLQPKDFFILVGKKGDTQKEKPKEGAPSAAVQSSGGGTAASATPGTEPGPEPAAPTAVPATTEPPGLASLVEMGYDRTRAQQALQAAGGDPTTAVAFLEQDDDDDGVGDGVDPENAEHAMQMIQQLADEGQLPAGIDAEQLQNMLGGHDGEGPSELELALMQIPDFEERRQQVLLGGQPAFQQMLDTMQQDYPELFQLVQANQEEFGDIMQHGLHLDGDEEGEEDAEMDQDQWQGGMPDQNVPLTDVDRAAIERLAGIAACDTQRATQAYVMAGKNEELAANLLFGD